MFYSLIDIVNDFLESYNKSINILAYDELKKIEVSLNNLYLSLFLIYLPFSSPLRGNDRPY